MAIIMIKFTHILNIDKPKILLLNLLNIGKQSSLNSLLNTDKLLLPNNPFSNKEKLSLLSKELDLQDMELKWPKLKCIKKKDQFIKNYIVILVN